MLLFLKELKFLYGYDQGKLSSVFQYQQNPNRLQNIFY